MPTAIHHASPSPRVLKPSKKAGGLVVRVRRGVHQVLLVSSVSRPGRWTLPKGTLEKDEDAKYAAAREIAEEAGVRGRLVRRLGVVERATHSITYYLFAFGHDVTWVENRLRERRWVDLEKAERHLEQGDLHEIIVAARRFLGSR
jgi:8-oxo-dGTP pyrophosphatase MutT (NUDIX family)